MILFGLVLVCVCLLWWVGGFFVCLFVAGFLFVLLGLLIIIILKFNLNDFFK